MLPGGAKYDDLPVLALATSLFGGGEATDPRGVSAAFKRAGAPKAVTLAKGAGFSSGALAVKWLIAKSQHCRLKPCPTAP